MDAYGGNIPEDLYKKNLKLFSDSVSDDDDDENDDEDEEEEYKKHLITV